MDMNEIERYKREMMKLYGKSDSVPEQPTKTSTEEKSPDIQQIPEYDDTAYAPHDDDDDSGNEGEYNTRYPEPDLSELDTDFGLITDENSAPPEYTDEKSLGTAKGYIIAYVRTGDESNGISGATVMVTAVVDGKRVILASGVTDRSGTSPRFVLPVPDTKHSQKPDPERRPYNLFDVSVTAEGFFNARSVDVPVFDGITSVQNFSMIPVPLMMQGSSETVTYYNKEPDFYGYNNK